MSLSEQREQQVLDAITGLTAEKGYPPTHAELRARLGFQGRSYTERLLNGLRDAGRVTWDPHRPRTLRVVHGSDQREPVGK